MATTHPHPNPARGLRVAFLLSFLAGAAIIGASVVVPMELTVLVGLPNAVMLLYLLGFLVRGRPAYLAEPFADSFYHLGFLFTVTSLLASLLPFVLEMAVPLTAEAILPMFGVALTTTLFGLIGRIAIRQFAMTVDRAETEIQASLSDRTQEFSDELDSLVAKVSGTIERLNSELAQTVDASVDGIQTASKTGIAEISDTAAAARESISFSTSTMSEQFEDQLRQAFQRGAATIDGFGETMDGLRDKTAAILEPFSAEMTGMVAELRNVREASARNEERITRIFETYEMMIAKLREAQEVGDRYQEQLGARISGIVTALEGAARTVDALAGDSKAVIGGLGQEIDSVRAARTELAADAATVAEVHARLSQELNAAIDRSSGQTPADAGDQPLEIDENAFGEIGRPTPDHPAGDDDDAYIPPLAARLRQPR